MSVRIYFNINWIICVVSNFTNTAMIIILFCKFIFQNYTVPVSEFCANHSPFPLQVSFICWNFHSRLYLNVWFIVMRLNDYTKNLFWIILALHFLKFCTFWPYTFSAPKKENSIKWNIISGFVWISNDMLFHGKIPMSLDFRCKSA